MATRSIVVMFLLVVVMLSVSYADDVTLGSTRHQVQVYLRQRELTQDEHQAVTAYMAAYGPRMSEQNRAATENALKLLLAVDQSHLPLTRTPAQYAADYQTFTQMLGRAYWYVDIPDPEIPAPVVQRMKLPAYEGPDLNPSLDGLTAPKLDLSGLVSVQTVVQVPVSCSGGSQSSSEGWTAPSGQAGAVRRSGGGYREYPIGGGWIGWHNYRWPSKPCEDPDPTCPPGEPPAGPNPGGAGGNSPGGGSPSGPGAGGSGGYSKGGKGNPPTNPPMGPGDRPPPPTPGKP